MSKNFTVTQFCRLFSLISLLGSTALVAEDTTTATLKTVSVTSSDWCPYVCPETLRNRGLVIEIITASLAEIELKTEYIYSKSREIALQQVKTGLIDILLNAGDDHSKILDLSKIFYVLDESVFVILKQRPITLNYPKDLLRYKLGGIEETIFDTKDGQWEKQITEHPNTLNVSKFQGEVSLLELLAKKRIDIALVNWDVAQYKLEQAQLKQFRIIEKGISFYFRLGFASSDRGRKIKSKFEQGFNRLIGTEKLKNIYAKYHIKMPKFSIID